MITSLFISKIYFDLILNDKIIKFLVLYFIFNDCY